MPTRGFNGKVSWIMHYIVVKLQLDKHVEIIQLFLHSTKNNYDMILGHKWLKQHNLRINWINDTLKFDIQYCWSNCLHSLSWHTFGHDYTNTTRYKLLLPSSMMLSKNNKQLLHKTNIKNSGKGFPRSADNKDYE